MMTKVDSGALDELQARSNLTRNQLLIWVGQKLHPELPIYNTPRAIWYATAIDPAHFQRAFTQLVAACDAFRIVFDEVEGVPQQRVLSEMPAPVEYLDFSGRRDPDAAYRAWAVERCQVPFDLGRCLFDCVLIKLQERRFVWYFKQHHLVTDGTSFEATHRWLDVFYLQSLEGKPPVKLALPSFMDYVAAERAYRESPQFPQDQAYWDSKLADELEPFMFYGRPTGGTTGVVRVSRTLGAERTARMKALAAQPPFAAKTGHAGLCNIFATLLVAYLHRLSGYRLIGIAMPYHNRRAAEFKETIGLLMEMLPLRLAIGETESFASLVEKVSAEVKAAIAHGRYAPGNSLHRHSYDVVFNYQPICLPDFLGTPVTTELYHPGHGFISFAVQLHDLGRTGSLTVDFDFHERAFDAAQRERAISHFFSLLEALLDDPSQSLHHAPLLAPEEARALAAFHQTAITAFPDDATIHQLFEKQARATPEQTAVVQENQSLTYGELNAHANALAHRLRGLGVGPETLVGVFAERSPEMIVAVLGVLKAGGAYVPLDPAYPRERLAFMLADANIPVLLAQERYRDQLPPTSARIVWLDTADTGDPPATRENPPAKATPENLAYVIYTSGSTGTPKGVAVPHHALVNFTTAAAASYEIHSNDRVLQFASLSFDAAAEEIFPCLTRGGTLVLRNDVMLASLPLFLERCAAWGVTVLDLPTAFWHELTARLAEDQLRLPASLRLVIIGGEAALPERVAQWRQHVRPTVRLLNTYGPTEATVVTTVADLTAPAGVATGPADAPIGRPIANTQVCVLDAHRQQVPLGVIGELHIGGAGLARGYLNRPELTAENFIAHPFTRNPAARLYKTGDLARWRPDGQLEYCGRMDRQVKVRGFRVELGEVEAALSRHAAVREVAAAAREDTPGDKRVVAYLVLHRSPAPPLNELRDFLKQCLPDHAIPSAFVFLDALPRTPAGKLDARALPAPGLAGQAEETFVSPRGALECQLAAIWEKVLGRTGLGARDNFFELGGHSLLAVRVFAELDRAFGRRLSLATLFQAPTIAQLAALLETNVETAAKSCLVAIQPRGTRPPFFCVHGVGGNVLNFHDLARHLAPDQPVYGLQSVGLDGREVPLTSFEAMAARYLRELRAHQPQGPYYLGGMSFGGLIAYEMACQLAAQGQPVGLLALFDTSSRGCLEMEPAAEQRRVRFESYWDRFQFNARQLLLGPRRGEYLRRKFQTLKRQFTSRVWRMNYRRQMRGGGAVPPVLHSVKELNFLAAQNYRPAAYAGRVALFRAAQSAVGSRHREPTLGWHRLAGGGVAVFEMPGDHTTMILDPHAAFVAEQLRACLDPASRARPDAALFTLVPSADGDARRQEAVGQ